MQSAIFLALVLVTWPRQSKRIREWNRASRVHHLLKDRQTKMLLAASFWILVHSKQKIIKQMMTAWVREEEVIATVSSTNTVQLPQKVEPWSSPSLIRALRVNLGSQIKTNWVNLCTPLLLSCKPRISIIREVSLLIVLLKRARTSSLRRQPLLG